MNSSDQTATMDLRNPWNPPGPRFVGRESEMESLRTHLENVASGDSRVLVVHGAEGMGKSRLLEAFERDVAEAGDQPVFIVRQKVSGYPDVEHYFDDFIFRLERAVVQAISHVQGSAKKETRAGLRLWRILESAKLRLQSGQGASLDGVLDALVPLLPALGSHVIAALKVLKYLLRSKASGRLEKRRPLALKNQLLESFQSFSDWMGESTGAFVLILDQWDQLRNNERLQRDLFSVANSVVQELQSYHRTAIIIGVRTDAITDTCAEIYNRTKAKGVIVTGLHDEDVRELLLDPYINRDTASTQTRIYVDPSAVDEVLGERIGEAPLVDLVEMMSCVWDEALAIGMDRIGTSTLHKLTTDTRREIVSRKLHTFWDLARAREEAPAVNAIKKVMDAIALVPDHDAVRPSILRAKLPAEAGYTKAVDEVLRLLSDERGCQLLYRKPRSNQDLRSPGEIAFFFRHGLIQQELRDVLGLNDERLKLTKLIAAANSLLNSTAGMCPEVLSLCNEVADSTCALDRLSDEDLRDLAGMIEKCLSSVGVALVKGGRLARAAYVGFAAGIGSTAICANLLTHPDGLVRAIARDLYGILQSATEDAGLASGDPLIEALKRDERTRSLLHRALRHGSGSQRTEAIGILLAIGEEEMLPGLLEALDDADESARRVSAKAMGRLGTDEAVGALRRALADTDENVRIEAARSLAAIGTQMAEEALLEGASSPNDAEQHAAIEGLSLVCSQAAAACLGSLLRSGSSDTRRLVVSGLEQLGSPEAVSELQAALADPDASVRKAAVAALGAHDSSETVAGLLRAVEDVDSGVRREAVRALARARSNDATAGLERVLGSGSSDLRSEAVSALGRSGTDSALNLVLLALKDSSASVRGEAARALAQFRSPEAASGLLRAIDDASSSVRRDVVLSLARCRGVDCVAGLVSALQDPDEEVRRAAIRGLSHMESPDVIPQLLKCLGDEDGDVRREAIAALGEAGSLAAVPGLTSVLRDDDVGVRLEAVEALGALRASASIPGLVRAATDRAPRIRRKAVTALVAMGDLEALGELRKAAERADDDLRREIFVLAAEAGAPDLDTPDEEPAASRGSMTQEPRSADPEEPTDISTWLAVKSSGDLPAEQTGQPLPGTRASEERARLAAAGTGTSGVEGAAPSLYGKLRDTDAATRMNAAIHLGMLRSDKAVPALSAALGDSDTGVRREAANSLGYIGRLSAVPHLLAALEDPKESVASAAAAALRTLSPPAVARFIRTGQG